VQASTSKVQQRPDSVLVPTRKARETKSATPAPISQKYSFTGRVEKVTDGDRISVRADGRAIKVRLHGIDTPEMKQTYGKNAKRALNRMLNGEEVGVRRIDTDRYGRTVGVVFFNDKNINLEMVCAGHAWWDERYAPKDKAMKKCHRNARVMGLGLWKDQHPVPTWEWRRR
jgi:micrococcal nuclease